MNKSEIHLSLILWQERLIQAIWQINEVASGLLRLLPDPDSYYAGHPHETSHETPDEFILFPHPYLQKKLYLESNNTFCQ
jgi:hypothetical protein